MSLNFDYLKRKSREERRQTPIEERTPNARRFAKKRLKDKLRPVLMAADPFCSRCGMALPDVDSGEAETFARVILAEQVLCCQACLNAKK